MDGPTLKECRFEQRPFMGGPVEFVLCQLRFVRFFVSHFNTKYKRKVQTTLFGGETLVFLFKVQITFGFRFKY